MRCTPLYYLLYRWFGNFCIQCTQCLVKDGWWDPTSFEKFDQSTQHNQTPQNNVTASEEFFLLITESHIVSAALSIFDMTSLNYDSPCSTHFFYWLIRPRHSATTNPFSCGSTEYHEFSQSHFWHTSKCKRPAAVFYNRMKIMLMNMHKKCSCPGFSWWCLNMLFVREMVHELSNIGGISFSFSRALVISIKQSRHSRCFPNIAC